MKLHILTQSSDNYHKALDLLRFYAFPTTDKNDKNVTLWSAEKETNLLGLVGFEKSGETGLLRFLAVAPEHHGKGVTRHLCNLVFKHVQNNGVAKLFLLTKQPWIFSDSLASPKLTANSSRKIYAGPNNSQLLARITHLLCSGSQSMRIEGTYIWCERHSIEKLCQDENRETRK